MSLWFLDDNEKPFAAAGNTAQPHPGPSPHQTTNPFNQPQDTYPGTQGYQQGPSPGQYSQGSQSSGEAASYFNDGPTLPLQGPPSQGTPYNQGSTVFQDPRARGVQSPYGTQSPPYGNYGQPPPEGMNEVHHGHFSGFQQQPTPDADQRGLFSRNPLDPPPAGFQRPPPGHFTYIQFAPMAVYTNTETLRDGFQVIPPPAKAGDQHPFASHDVTEEDWHRFLTDLERTAHLSPTERLGNFFKHNSPGVQERLKRDRIEPVGDYLLAWNQYFFHPRRMNVVLALGSQRYSGETEDAPPDLYGHRKHSSSKRSGSDSESSSDSDSDHKHSGKHGQRREERRARREDRRERRHERLQAAHSHSHSHSEGGHSGCHKHSHEGKPQVYVSDTKFRLVVCFWDGHREVC